MIYESAAKINLYLSVDGLLPGGYHRLTSVMQSVSLYDRIHFAFEKEAYSLTLSSPELDLGPVEKNIVTRSWKLMKERFGLPGEMHACLDKRIPVGAGLAGGSGNGAAVFHAVNDYFELHLSPEELASLGSEIGADVPFCIRGGTMLARGKGEVLEALPALCDTEILLVNGGFHVSTPEIFRRFDSLPKSAVPSVSHILHALERNESVMPHCYNDLERVTIPMHESLSDLKRYLKEQGLVSLMSGSGPTIFALTDSQTADEVQKNWDDRWGRMFRCKPAERGVVAGRAESFCMSSNKGKTNTIHDGGNPLEE